MPNGSSPSAPMLTLSAPLLPLQGPRISTTTDHRGAARTGLDQVKHFASASDEVLVGLAQSLPKLEKEILTLASAAGFTPLIMLGTAGVAKEAKEVFRDYVDHLDAVHEVQKDILLNAQASLELQRPHLSDEAYQGKKASLEQLSNTFNKLHQKIETRKENASRKGVVESLKSRSLTEFKQALRDKLPTSSQTRASRQFAEEAKNLPKLDDGNALQMERLERKEDLRKAANIERFAAVLKTLSMAGMTAGTMAEAARSIAALIKAAAETASYEALDVSATAASHVLSTVTSGIFIPSQAAMIGAETCHLASLMSDNKGLEKDRQLVRSLDPRHIDQATLNAVQEVIEKEQRLNTVQGAGSVAIIAGQSCMVTSSICHLTGIGVVAVVPLSATGAVLTLTGDVTQKVARHKEKHFKGAEASQPARVQQQDRNETINRLIGVHRLQSAMQRANEHFKADQAGLAEAKLLSLIDYAYKKEAMATQSRPGQFSVKRIHQHVKAMLNDGQKKPPLASPLADIAGIFNSTSLTKSDLEKMKDIFGRKYNFSIFLTPHNDTPFADREHFETGLQKMAEQHVGTLDMSDTRLKEKAMKKTVETLIKNVRKFNASDFVSLEPGQKKKDISYSQFRQFMQSNPEIHKIEKDFSRPELIKAAKTDLKYKRHAAAKNIVESGYALRQDAGHRSS